MEEDRREAAIQQKRDSTYNRLSQGFGVPGSAALIILATWFQVFTQLKVKKITRLETGDVTSDGSRFFN